MSVTISTTNKPLNPRAQDLSPKGYNRASLYSGKALDFDGVNDSVGLGAISGTLSNLSMSWYIKTTNTADFQCLFANGAGKFDVYIRPDKKIHVWTGSQQSFYEIPDIQTGDWINLVLVKDGANASLYYNGQLAQTIAFSGSSFSITNGFVGIGLNSLYDFNGQIAGFKIFNTALTAAQVSDLYLNPEKIVPDGVANSALKLWLPMMEGAGTTAYDGSGNGNHGTINGATWVSGIGAPVAQSAVMNWNKGTNFYSDSDWEVSSATTNASISSSSHSAPNRIDTASVFDDGTGSTYKRGYKVSNTTMAIGQITASTFVKKKDVDYINVVLGTDGGTYKFFALVDLVNGTINDTSGNPTATSIQSVGDGWYYVSVQGAQTTLSQGIAYIYGQDPTNGSSIDDSYTGANNQTYIWGINIQEGAINNVHLPTIGTLQTTPVLLPQGLTTGRDITGVNLFENVRNQFALNLDGNSWAEVHDNASLDVTTGLSLEAWVYSSASDATVGDGVLSKWHEGSNKRSFLMYALDFDSFYFFVSNDGAATNSVTFGINSADYEKYNHFVCTFDGTNLKAYVNGALYNTSAATFSSIYNSDKNVAIGNYNIGQTPERKYNNSIALPRIYNRALSATEVSRNYNADRSKFGL
jgi:hypothetical protein